VPLLRERFGVPHVLAISLLVAGQAWIAGHTGTIAFGQGEAMILAATILWAIEVVLAKRLLGAVPSPTLGAARMAIGTGVLLGWVAVSGRAGRLCGPRRRQWRWILLTGLLLTVCVATWYAALAGAGGRRDRGARLRRRRHRAPRGRGRRRG
jgi:drug/metabolite transporter (DMT)-like permease